MLSRNEQEMMNADYHGYFQYIKFDMIESSKSNFHIALGETADDAGVSVNKFIKLEKVVFQLTCSMELVKERITESCCFYYFTARNDQLETVNER